jgi:hypothetical protein
LIPRSGMGREGSRKHTPVGVRRRRSARRPTNNGQRNSPCRRRYERKTEAERGNGEVVGRKGSAAPAGLELQLGQGSVEGGARGARVESGGRRGSEEEEIQQLGFRFPSWFSVVGPLKNNSLEFFLGFF